ncbi:DsbA family protein [Actinoplanes sp. NEAU-A12]|uniref:2-hydroxychromene-2-carboxylate isomerase n=1 Tax=Actinoplanes sandaracinus TaxID=3045177 RepID=A0ABT6WHP1_9ACTN|nr:DsbA family protein [Actinoplanes sandaracinus]MDI6099246.1 DsbA family protein [Actinoplanes sandaracinus]
MRKPPRMYFSFRSPRSWLALRRFEETRPDLAATVRLVPNWDPKPWLRDALDARGSGVLQTPITLAKHLYLLADTERLVQKFGYRMTWPADLGQDWEVPHLLWLHADAVGLGPQFYQAAVRARWERGENLCDPAVLRDVAAQAGLDPDQVAGAAGDESLRAAAVEALDWAYQDDIFGVPYFLAGRHRFWGLERLPGFIDALDAAAEKAKVRA